MKFDLILSLSVFEAIIEVLERKSYIEQVGLCFGVISDEKRVKMEEFTEIDNLDISQSSFSVDYTVLLNKIEFYQRKGKNYLGLFHSHPLGHSPLPSKKDRQFMKYWTFPFIWLIGVSPQLLAFSFSHNQVYQIPYRISD